MRWLLLLLMLSGCAAIRQQEEDEYRDLAKQQKAKAEQEEAQKKAAAERQAWILTLPCADQCRERHLDCGHDVTFVLLLERNPSAAEVFRHQCRDRADICLEACARK